MEDVGVELLEAEVLDAEVAHHLLQINKAAGGKIGPMVEHIHVVAQGKADLRHGRVLQQMDDTRGYAHLVETEEVALVPPAHLEQGDQVVLAFVEDGARLRIDAQDGLVEKFLYRFLCLLLARDRDDFARKRHARKLRNGRLVKLAVYDSLH